MQIPDSAPFTDEQKAALNQLLPTLSAPQLQWLMGFAAGVESALRQEGAYSEFARTAIAPAGTPAATAQPAAETPQAPLTIVFGSESGNAEGLAQEIRREAGKRGLAPIVRDMADCAVSDLSGAENLLVITSTWGDGDPPENAVELHTALMSASGNIFKDTKFSVLALGDTSYDKFCQTGKDFDQKIEELGGTRIADRVDCDVDYEEPAQKWQNTVLDKLAEQIKEAQDAAAAPAFQPASLAAPPAPDKSPATVYGKKNPFPAPMKHKVLLSGRGSKKETWHFELGLEGSGLTYEPGDSLAVVPKNADDVVEAVMQAGNFVQTDLPVDGGSSVSLDSALAISYDITTLSKRVLEKYNAFAKSKKIDRLLDPKNSKKLKDYIYGRQIVDMLEDFPVKKMTGEEFTSILRKLPPRLYSIASSLRAHPEEVHLTIAAVRYESHGRRRKGVASTYLADLVEEGEKVPAYVTPNKHFKLPSDPGTPIIMVGPGTGIAPFRAFLEDREATGATGKSWLFYGDWNFTYDFSYQTELQGFLKGGVLTRLETAFSRDQKEKVYVQHRMVEKENARELYRWLEEGAYFYVCGSDQMAPAVQDALIRVVERESGKSHDEAEAYVLQMQKEKRYLKDVY